MKSFNQFILEAFDKPYPYNLNKTGDEDYRADVKLPDGSTLRIEFSGLENTEDPGELSWEIIFSRIAKGKGGDGTISLTGQGDQMRIFATVIAATKEFIKKENPKYIDFSASKDYDPFEKDNPKAMQSRERLYTRFVKKYFAKDYKIYANSNMSGTVWYLERK